MPAAEIRLFFSVSLKTGIGSIEEINGFVRFYEKYADISSQMDFRDTCYFDKSPHLSVTPELKPLYEQVHYVRSRVRNTRILLNLHNRAALPWIIFYRFPRDREALERKRIEFRGFRCFSGIANYVVLPHIVLLYDSIEIDNGVLILSLFDNERQQRNLIIKNKQLFGFFREAYEEMFESSERLDITEIRKMYVDLYGYPSVASDIEINVKTFYADYAETVGTEEDASRAIEVWKSVFEL